MADQYANYCEAYLVSNELCEAGSRCCVSRDNPVKQQQLTQLAGHRFIPKNGINQTLPVNPVQLISLIINSDRTSTSKPVSVHVVTILLFLFYIYLL